MERMVETTQRDNQEIVCSICLDPFEKNAHLYSLGCKNRHKKQIKLACRHQFHQKCIHNWFMAVGTFDEDDDEYLVHKCPMCRADVSIRFISETIDWNFDLRHDMKRRLDFYKKTLASREPYESDPEYPEWKVIYYETAIQQLAYLNIEPDVAYTYETNYWRYDDRRKEKLRKMRRHWREEAYEAHMRVRNEEAEANAEEEEEAVQAEVDTETVEPEERAEETPSVESASVYSDASDASEEEEENPVLDVQGEVELETFEDIEEDRPNTHFVSLNDGTIKIRCEGNSKIRVIVGENDRITIDRKIDIVSRQNMTMTVQFYPEGRFDIHYD